MRKPILVQLRLIFVFAVALGGVFLLRQGLGEPPGARAAPAVRAQQGVTQQAAVSTTTWTSAGATVTQTFTLQAGWNTIYLAVDPINPSPLVNEGTDEEPFWTHELPSLLAVFDGLSCNDCLESVWTWNVPLSTMEYIVDPAEGLWDEEGWQRYFPETSLNAEGNSQAFLTDLVSLNANTGYLVKLRDDLPAPTTLAVVGKPVVRKHRWSKDAYNLAGFPILPGATPTVSDFFAGSPLTEVHRLNSAGEWEPLAGSDSLRDGEAYLVYYDDSDPDAADDYTAPIDLVEPLSEGLTFAAGLGGRSASFTLENLTAADVSVSLSLLDGADAGVALRLTAPVTGELKAGPVTLDLPAAGAARLEFAVRSTEQPRDGEALLAIASADLGVRWLLPVSARGTSLAGLWVGEVTVDDVSESRLGATNVDDGLLTLALRQRNQSDVRGAAEMQEIVQGSSVSTAVTLTLDLPVPDEIPVPEPISTTAPFVGGYVFEDANQNGQRDGDEAGLAGVTVSLNGVGDQQTGADGSYLFEGVAPGSYDLTVATPAGYTNQFDVLVPGGAGVTANAVPAAVTAGAAGISGVTPAAYLEQTLPPPHTLPYFDATDTRVEPLLNFGLVRVYDASLWTVGPGGCSDRLAERQALGQVKNGHLAATLSSTALNPGLAADDLLLGGGSDYAVLVQQNGEDVACGEVVVGAPTRFDNGLGSAFRFRLLLRVAEDGRAELLPYYQVSDDLRLSSAALSIDGPLAANGRVDDPDPLLNFAIGIDPNDPLNPYRHKYHPDHDNLDARFNPIDLDAVDPHLWESFEVRRRIQLSLTGDPPGVPEAEVADLAVELDWGGMTWGGLYKEVVQGLHKNDITARGIFVIQHVLTADQLQAQDYD